MYLNINFSQYINIISFSQFCLTNIHEVDVLGSTWNAIGNFKYCFSYDRKTRDKYNIDVSFAKKTYLFPDMPMYFLGNGMQKKCKKCTNTCLCNIRIFLTIFCGEKFIPIHLSFTTYITKTRPCNTQKFVL